MGFALGERKRQGVDDLESERYSISYTHSHYTPHTHYGQGNFESNTHIVHVYY